MGNDCCKETAVRQNAAASGTSTNRTDAQSAYRDASHQKSENPEQVASPPAAAAEGPASKAPRVATADASSHKPAAAAPAAGRESAPAAQTPPVNPLDKMVQCNSEAVLAAHPPSPAKHALNSSASLNGVAGRSSGSGKVPVAAHAPSAVATATTVEYMSASTDQAQRLSCSNDSFVSFHTDSSHSQSSNLDDAAKAGHSSPPSMRSSTQIVDRTPRGASISSTISSSSNSSMSVSGSNDTTLGDLTLPHQPLPHHPQVFTPSAHWGEDTRKNVHSSSIGNVMAGDVQLTSPVVPIFSSSSFGSSAGSASEGSPQESLLDGDGAADTNAAPVVVPPLNLRGLPHAAAEAEQAAAPDALRDAKSSVDSFDGSTLYGSSASSLSSPGPGGPAHMASTSWRNESPREAMSEYPK